jgi:O-antigen ligase
MNSGLTRRLSEGRASLTRSDAPFTAAPRNWYPAFTVAFLVVALVCGGSSSSALSAAVVRIGAVPVLALGLWRLSQRPTTPGARWPLILLAAGGAVIVAQLIPMPPDVWQALPGHRTVADGYRAAEMAAPWLPISLTPDATWSSLLGLIPPSAMLIATLTLAVSERRLLAAAVLAVALLSAALGMLQKAGGTDSALRLYAITNPESAVGFFANRNHQADFLALTLPLAAYLAARWAGRGRARTFFWAAVGVGFAIVMASCVATTGSRAGLLLVALGTAGGGLVVLRAHAKSPGPGWRLAALAAPAALTLMAAGLITLAVDPRLERAVLARSGPELRLELNPEVARAGRAFAPLGSGAGSFATVYQMFEPLQSMGPTFVNHAHDDFVEVWLEAGVAGTALVLAFAAWWVAATWHVVQDRRVSGAALSLAGSLMVGMSLIHSLVDYPLRTPALITLFAFACGLIVPPPAEPGEGRGRMRLGSRR